MTCDVSCDYIGSTKECGSKAKWKFLKKGNSLDLLSYSCSKHLGYLLELDSHEVTPIDTETNSLTAKLPITKRDLRIVKGATKSRKITRKV